VLHPGANREEVGFELSYPIRVRFATRDGSKVPMSAISSVTIANSLGGRFTFAPSDPPALLVANRILRIQLGLYVQPIRYSVRTVLFGGSNVVYAGSQNFYVHPNQVWTVKILLFPMRLEVRDALFGFGIGTAVLIRRSDGASRLVRLGTGHAVTVPNMPRATYELIAKGPGFGFSAPATLTKPLVARLLLLSWIDIAAVGTFIVLFVAGLPLLGGRLIRRKGRRIRLLAWHTGDPEAAAETGLEAAAEAGLEAAAETGLEAAAETGKQHARAEPGPSDDQHEAEASARDAVGATEPDTVELPRIEPARPEWPPVPAAPVSLTDQASVNAEPPEVLSSEPSAGVPDGARVASIPGPIAEQDPPEPWRVA